MVRLLFPSAPGVKPLLIDDEGRDPTGVTGTEELLDDAAFEIGRIRLSLPATVIVKKILVSNLSKNPTLMPQKFS